MFYVFVLKSIIPNETGRSTGMTWLRRGARNRPATKELRAPPFVQLSKWERPIWAPDNKFISF